MLMAFDTRRAVDYAQPLKPLKRNATLMPSMQVFSVDFGPENSAYWVGRYSNDDDDDNNEQQQRRIVTLSWAHFALLGDTASARQAYLVERVLIDRHAADSSDYMLELQKPMNAITKRAENVGAYGLQCALMGGLCAATRLRPTRERRVYPRSPVHKFSVLGVACPRKKADRKKLARRIAYNYLSHFEPANSLAWRTWEANSDKQDDLADAMVGGMSALIEVDERAPTPRLAHIKRAMIEGIEAPPLQATPPAKSKKKTKSTNAKAKPKPKPKPKPKSNKRVAFVSKTTAQ